jgi:hypothetical protein
MWWAIASLAARGLGWVPGLLAFLVQPVARASNKLSTAGLVKTILLLVLAYGIVVQLGRERALFNNLVATEQARTGTARTKAAACRTIDDTVRWEPSIEAMCTEQAKILNQTADDRAWDAYWREKPSLHDAWARLWSTFEGQFYVTVAAGLVVLVAWNGLVAGRDTVTDRVVAKRARRFDDNMQRLAAALLTTHPTVAAAAGKAAPGPRVEPANDGGSDDEHVD